MTRFFTEAQLPETCYVQEVAYWISLGTLPEFSPDDGDQDFRQNADVIWDGSLTFSMRDLERNVFGWREFLSVGVELTDAEVERYQNARNTSFGKTGEEHIRRDNEMRELVANRIREAGGEYFPPTPEQWQSISDRVRREALDADWVKEIEAPFSLPIDIARTMVFRALASGELKATGWVAYTDLELAALESEGEESPLGRFTDVPPSSWTLRYFDWDECQLTTHSTMFKSVQVKVADMLALFPKPECKAIAVDGNVFGGTLVLDDGTGSAPLPRKTDRGRGRPLKANGYARKVIQNHFRREMAAGRVARKKEALVQEVIEYAEEVLKEKISRSTAQEYLAPLFETPENNAGK